MWWAMIWFAGVSVYHSPTANAQAGAKRPRPNMRSSKKVQTGVASINYPDTVNLSSFVDYVSQTLGLQIVYGDELREQSVVLRPSKFDLPHSQLLDLLKSMLRMHDLAVVPGDIEDWLRIVRVDDMPRHVTDINISVDKSATISQTGSSVVTHAIQLQTAEVGVVVKHLRRFLASEKASIIEIPDRNLLIITDYESAVARAIDIIKLVDVPAEQVDVIFKEVTLIDPQTITDQVVALLGEQAKYTGIEVEVTLRPDIERSGILAVGKHNAVKQAIDLIARFDAADYSQRPIVAYTPKHIAASRLEQLVEAFLLKGKSDPNIAELFLDTEANKLFVTAQQSFHRRVEKILAAQDVAGDNESRPLRIYRPRNRQASDIISALSQLLPQTQGDALVVNANPTATENDSNSSGTQPNDESGNTTETDPNSTASTNPSPAAPIRLAGEDFVLTADEHTNSILAIGTPEFHAKLQRLMKELDRRRPQVMIELTLVAVTFNDSVSVAVELLNEETVSNYQSLLFSSFGLSDVSLADGKRSFSPGGGLNYMLVGPNETPLLLRAIAAHGNSRIISTPKILVSDNTAATITSVSEEPFTSINASSTVSTTSFAGFESAGTTLTVTPRIREGNHLVLDYSFNFSNFTGGGSVGVPPPRATNSFSGTVEIPDLHTAVIGGLVTENESDSVTEVPVLGRIPVIGPLFQTSDRARTKSRIFAFIHPTILREDKFEDLRLVTDIELNRADLKNKDYPDSQYQWMR